MYRPERGSGLHCDNGRLQAGTCASVKEGDNAGFYILNFCKTDAQFSRIPTIVNPS